MAALCTEHCNESIRRYSLLLLLLLLVVVVVVVVVAAAARAYNRICATL